MANSNCRHEKHSSCSAGRVDLFSFPDTVPYVRVGTKKRRFSLLGTTEISKQQETIRQSYISALERFKYICFCSFECHAKLTSNKKKSLPNNILKRISVKISFGGAQNDGS